MKRNVLKLMPFVVLKSLMYQHQSEAEVNSGAIEVEILSIIKLFYRNFVRNSRLRPNVYSYKILNSFTSYFILFAKLLQQRRARIKVWDHVTCFNLHPFHPTTSYTDITSLA
jgi:hypothetical protein